MLGSVHYGPVFSMSRTWQSCSAPASLCSKAIVPPGVHRQWPLVNEATAASEGPIIDRLKHGLEAPSPPVDRHPRLAPQAARPRAYLSPGTYTCALHLCPRL